MLKYLLKTLLQFTQSRVHLHLFTPTPILQAEAKSTSVCVLRFYSNLERIVCKGKQSINHENPKRNNTFPDKTKESHPWFTRQQTDIPEHALSVSCRMRVHPIDFSDMQLTTSYNTSLFHIQTDFCNVSDIHRFLKTSTLLREAFPTSSRDMMNSDDGRVCSKALDVLLPA